MSPTSTRTLVYAERGSKRVFAGALTWPGWCRGARTEPDALEALIAYGPRFARVVEGTGLRFAAPKVADDLEVVERLEGTPTTDFGAPDVAPADDDRPVSPAELERLCTILGACWATLDRAADEAEGVALRTGPRGGGRNLEAIVAHVLGAESSYLGRLAAPKPALSPEDLYASAAEIRGATIAALRRAVTRGPPRVGSARGQDLAPALLRST